MSMVRELPVDSILLRESHEIASIASAMTLVGQKNLAYTSKIMTEKYAQELLYLSFPALMRLIINTHDVIGSGDRKTQIWWRRIFDRIRRLQSKADKEEGKLTDDELTLAAGIFQVLATRIQTASYHPQLSLPGLPGTAVSGRLTNLTRLEQCCLAARLAKHTGYVPIDWSDGMWRSEIEQARFNAAAPTPHEDLVAVSLSIICS